MGGSFQLVAVDVLQLLPTVNDLTSVPIFVAVDRVRLCYPEQGEDTWTDYRRRKRKAKSPKEKPDNFFTTTTTTTTTQ